MPSKPRVPKLSLPKFLSRPPFARPSRADWMAGVGRDLGRRAADRAKTAWVDAAHATAQAAQGADTATAGAQSKLKAAAREAMAHARFGKPKPRPADPRPSDRRKGRAGAHPKAKPSKARGSFGGIEATALFVLAGVIVAWPRPGRPSLLEGLQGALGATSASPEATVAEASEPGRGRTATSPLSMPLRGWKDVLARTWSEFNVDQIPAVAGGVTFFGLLSMFPAMAAFVSLYGLFADVAQARAQLRLLAGFLPHDILTFVGDEMVRIAGGHPASLGLTFGLSLLFSIWSANGAVKALIYGLNVAYEERERRNLVVLNLTSLAFTLGAIAFVLVALIAVVVLPVVFAGFGMLHLNISLGGAWLAQLRWPALLMVLILGLSALYRYGPSRQQSRWRWITVGGVVAGVLWVGASLLFSWYVANFAHYDRTYGSLGAVIGFMFWLWYSTIIVLFGAELNAELEHQTAVDTTTGAPKPAGARGARMADTLGRARGAPKG